VRVLCHRGLWRSAEEQNTLAALARSFDAELGVETDVRDHHGELVISHDPPNGGAPPTLRALLDARAGGEKLPLALNVKADGLAGLIADALADRTADDSWFAFDMSVPETIAYRAAGLPFFTRQSDLEPEPALYEDAAGVWVDAFGSDWVTEAVVTRHVEAGKQVALISPELHGRPHEPVWARWARWEVVASPAVLLCTDLPESARRSFPC
jgi:hypothetical protein